MYSWTRASGTRPTVQDPFLHPPPPPTSHSTIFLRNMSRLTTLLLLAATAASLALSSAGPRSVVVTGAGGQTGQHLFRRLLALPDEFRPLGLVRSEESRAALLEGTGAPADSVAVADVTDAAAVRRAAKGCDAFCVCTSAKPKMLEGVTDAETGRPVFAFPNGTPEEVDWVGQRNQIDACGPSTHVVLCSSMGGTDPDHPLNNLGRVTDADGASRGGNILKWKRKAEVYLMGSGRPYTIVHPGGLIDEAGGERELVLGVDDGMDGTESRTVPREDVASVMLSALRHPDLYANRSLDLRAKEVGDGAPTTDFRELVENFGDKNCDYSLGEVA